MNVGICAPYQPRDATYAAIQVADLARRQGNEVSFLATTPRRPAVDTRWDAHVLHESCFTEWARPRDVVVWVGCPPSGQVDWFLASGEGLRRRAVLVATRDDSGAAIAAVYPRFTRVVAPSAASARHLVGAMPNRARNVIEVPWSPCLPLTAPAGRVAGPLRLHVPLCEAQTRTSDACAVFVVERLLRRDVPVQIVVSLNGRSGETVRRLRRRAHESPRLAIARRNDFESLLLSLAAYDFTVVPAVGESFGMLALCSRHAGVPVFAFDASPMDEVAARGGVLVPCAVTGRPPGVALPSAEDWDAFADALARLAADPAAADGLRGFAGHGLADRRARFEYTWGVILAGK
jgi:hypothetical protein